MTPTSHRPIADRREPSGGTRQRLLEVGSRLFASESVDGVSIRRITREARVGPASVHYHFSDKDTLVAEIIQSQGAIVLASIAARATSLRRQARVPSATELVETIALPYFELIDREPVRGYEWLNIVAQLAAANDGRVQRPSTQATAEVQAVLGRLYPDVDENYRLACWSMTVNSLLAALARKVIESGEAHAALRREDLVAFLAGGLEISVH